MSQRDESMIDDVRSALADELADRGITNHRVGGRYWSSVDIEVEFRDQLVATLRSAPVSEPIAWRWRYRKDPNPRWYFVEYPLSDDNRNLEIEPLYINQGMSRESAQ